MCEKETRINDVISQAKQVLNEWAYKESCWTDVKIFFFPPPQAFPLSSSPARPKKKVELFGVLTHELSHYQALGFQRHILGPPLTSRWLCAWNQANRSLPRIREEKQKGYNSHIIFTTVIFWRVLWICNYEVVVYIPKSPLLQDNMVMLLKNVSCWEQRQWGVEHFSTVCAYNNFFLLNNKTKQFIHLQRWSGSQWIWRRSRKRWT